MFQGAKVLISPFSNVIVLVVLVVLVEALNTWENRCGRRLAGFMHLAKLERISGGSMVAFQSRNKYDSTAQRPSCFRGECPLFWGPCNFWVVHTRVMGLAVYPQIEEPKAPLMGLPVAFWCHQTWRTGKSLG